jgi:hypothetical protein
MDARYTRTYWYDAPAYDVAQTFNRGQLAGFYPDQAPQKRGRNQDEDLCLFLDQLCARWFNTPFTLQTEFMAEYRFLDLDYRAAKIRSYNAHMDRCLIESTDDPSMYAIFDMRFKRGFGGVSSNVLHCHTYEVHEWNIPDHEMTLMRLIL